MSIESNMNKQTAALESIAASMAQLVGHFCSDSQPQGGIIVGVDPAEGESINLPTEESPVKPVETKAPPAPKAKVPPAPKTAPVEETVVLMTSVEVNAKLVEEFNRLGDKQLILSVLNDKYGAAGVSDVDPSQYANLLADVAALQV